jgi:hypothetical protein
VPLGGACSGQVKLVGLAESGQVWSYLVRSGHIRPVWSDLVGMADLVGLVGSGQVS